MILHAGGRGKRMTSSSPELQFKNKQGRIAYVCNLSYTCPRQPDSWSYVLPKTFAKLIAHGSNKACSSCSKALSLVRDPSLLKV